MLIEEKAPVDAVQALLGAGADANSLGKGSYSPLHLAASSGRAEVIRLLLRAGADPRQAQGGSWTPLHAAAACSKAGAAAACCEALLLSGATQLPILEPESEEDWFAPPLRIAADSGRADAAAVLLAFSDGENIAAAAAEAARGAAEDEEEEAWRQVIRRALPLAVGVAQRQLDALQEPAAARLAAAALLDARLETAVGGAAVSGGSRCPLARLRALRSPALAWEEAWRHAPPAQQRTRFSGALDRLAWALALQAWAEQAEAAAAERTVRALRQLRDSAAPCGSKERDRLTNAAAMCVAKWWGVKQVHSVDGPQEAAAATAGFAAARAKAEETLAQLRRAAASLATEAGQVQELAAAVAPQQQ